MKLKAAYETDVYVGGAGDIVLRQPDALAFYGVKDNVVILSAAQGRELAYELLRLADELEGDS